MATYYVDTAVGNDANAGTSEGAGNAWATIDKAMNTATTAGDIVYVKATGTYSETPNIDVAGGAVSPIVYIGYGTTTGDNEKVTVSGTTNCLTCSVTNIYYAFKNFIFSGASSHGVDFTSQNQVHFFNCEFNSNGGSGIVGGSGYTMLNCVAHSNTNSGFKPTSLFYAAGCVAYGNGDVQFDPNNSSSLYKCVGYGSTGSSSVVGGNSCTIALGNTFDGENVATQGVACDSNSYTMCFDNIVYDCTTAIKIVASPFVTRQMTGYNLLNSNTTDYDNTHTGVGYQDVSGAPAFTNEAGDDYTLGEASPAIGAGLTPGGIT